MMLFQDGSIHRWIGALDHDLNLIVTLDDATSRITSALLIEEEGTMSSFVGLSETIEAYGLLGALHTDRGSHYFHTQAGKKVDKTHPTQVGRAALGQLGIRHIPSYSPRAWGRMERVFGYSEATPGLGSDAAFDFAGFNGRALADRDGWCHRRYSVHADLGGCGVRPGCQRQRGRSGLAARAWPFIPQPKSADVAALSRGRIGQRVEPRQDVTQHE